MPRGLRNYETPNSRLNNKEKNIVGSRHDVATYKYIKKLMMGEAQGYSPGKVYYRSGI